MITWKPMLVLPNLDIRGAIECDIAALVSVTDSRVEVIRAQQPRFQDFLSRFKNQFGEQVWPSVIMLNADAPPSYCTAEAMQGFRDLCAVSVIPYARAKRMCDKADGSLTFSNIFDFYPWMIDKNYENMLCINSAMRALHLLEEFHGQSFPEQGHTSLTEQALDKPLLKSLLTKWAVRFSISQPDWKDVALFRSLNMANQAGQLPAMTATSIYDVGRSIALWVSAHEILIHPGQNGKSKTSQVTRLLDKAPWSNAQFTDPIYPLTSINSTKQVRFGTWLYNHVYSLRNDFLHGNLIDPNKMAVGQQHRLITDIAACLFRMALTASLNVKFEEPNFDLNDTLGTVRLINEKSCFNNYQLDFEQALLSAKPPRGG